MTERIDESPPNDDASSAFPGEPPRLSRHDLYEVCVQSAADLPPLIAAVAEDIAPEASPPMVLAEDFAGTAALSRAWVSRGEGHRAIATDSDAEALHHHDREGRPPPPGLTKRHTDVLNAADPACVVFVGNFSIGYWHTRRDLVRYLRHARDRLLAGPDAGGRPRLFLCDTYGGDSAFLTGDVHRDHWISAERHGRANPALAPYDGCRVRYTWEQRHADPLTGRVTDVCHFRLARSGTVLDDYADAFVYEWRLWSVPELRDAMTDAGFADTRVYSKLPDAIDHEGRAYVRPITDPESELDDSFIVLVAARADAQGPNG